MIKNLIFKLYKKRVICIFIILEMFSLIITINEDISVRMFKPIFNLSKKINENFYFFKNYRNIFNKNAQLLKVNARLKEKILTYENRLDIDKSKVIKDKKKYVLISSKVINNSYNFLKNYITINKGFDHGIKKNMGVIAHKGIVGIVKNTSKNYSIILSLLHIDNYLSVKLKKNNFSCSLKWDGENYRYMKLLFIPKSYKINIGDEVVTTGFDGTFPKNMPIGKIITIKKNNSLFCNITVKLYMDFPSLEDVYVVKNIHKEIIEKLERKTKKFYGY